MLKAPAKQVLDFEGEFVLTEAYERATGETYSLEDEVTFAEHPY